MFWNRKRPKAPSEPLSPVASTVPKTEVTAPQAEADILEEVTATLVTALRKYSDAANKANEERPDAELKNAYAIVAAAEKLVNESRLAYALGRCLAEHIQYWPSWSKRDNFKQYVGFDALKISANSHEEQGSYRSIKVAIVDFIFQGTGYQLILRDEGVSSVPDEPYRFGEIELVAEGKRVARLGLIQDISNEHATWKHSEVRSLVVGPWMQDVLDMAAQIEAWDQKRRRAFFDDRARAAAREIYLGQ